MKIKSIGNILKECFIDYVKYPSEENKNNLILACESRIKRMADRLANFYHVQDVEDLVQNGFEGAMKSIERFSFPKDESLVEQEFNHFLQTNYYYIEKYIEEGIGNIKGLALINVNIKKLEGIREQIEKESELELKTHPELARIIVDKLIETGVVKKEIKSKLEDYIQFMYCSSSSFGRAKDPKNYEEEAVENVHNQDLEEIAKGLSEFDRKVFKLMYVEGYRESDAAKELGVRPDLVSNANDRIIRRFRHPANIRMVMNKDQYNNVYDSLLKFRQSFDEDSQGPHR